MRTPQWIRRRDDPSVTGYCVRWKLPASLSETDSVNAYTLRLRAVCDRNNLANRRVFYND